MSPGNLKLIGIIIDVSDENPPGLHGNNAVKEIKNID
jgi:hypothetical protein